MQVKNNKNKKSYLLLALYISNPVIYSVMRNENTNQTKGATMKLGTIITFEDKFKNEFGTNAGNMRLSVFTAWCNNNGLDANAQLCLSSRLYEDCVVSVQFDAHMDLIEGRK